MSALYAATLSAFKEMGWHYWEVPGHAVIEADFEAHHTKVPLHVQVYGETHIASVVATCTLEVPATHRLPVCELLMRTNRELNIGNFELDWDSGTVLFRATNIFPPHRHDPRILTSLVHSAISEVDRLTPFLGEIVRTPKGELILLKVADLMKREDLLRPLLRQSRKVRQALLPANMPARYALQNHPAFSDPLTKEDLYILVARGSLARGEMVECDETGAMHTVGEVISGMRPPRESPVARPAFREITPDFEGPPGEAEEEAGDEEEDDDGDDYAYTAGGEVILHHSHPSWLAYSKTLLLALLLAVAAGLLFLFEPVYALVALVLSFIVLFGVFVARVTHDHIVTPQRVELLWGIIGRNSKEARICDIRSIDVYESGIKGMLGLGTIDFSTAANAGIEVQFRDMRRAHEVKELVRRLQSGDDPTKD